MAAAAFRSATRRDAGSATRGRAAAAGVAGGSGGLRRSRSLSRFPPPSPSPEDAVTPSSRFVNKNDMDVSHRYGSRGINAKSSTGNSMQNSFHKSAKVNQTLRRSTSQKDFLHSRDSSSSHSSLTDDESRDAHYFHSRNQKGIRAVYALEKEHPIGDKDGNVLYDVMRKEVRQAVEEVKTQLEKAVTKSEPSEKATSTDAQPTQVITELRRSYTSKLEESEKRKQELLAQLVAEEQHGHELTKIVRELLPTTKKNVNPERQPCHRRRSNDKARMSRRLIEEAEQYFEDFLSNVEDTDFSSFDGERSDTSSTRRDVLLHGMIETPIALPKVASPVESDGVVLPWLQWETSNDLRTSPCKTKTQGASTACSTSNHTMSSRGSWSPGDHDSSAVSKDKLLYRFDEVGIRQSSCNTPSSSFHIDDYLHLQRSEDLLFERWRQKQRIDDGGLILCSRSTIM